MLLFTNEQMRAFEEREHHAYYARVLEFAESAVPNFSDYEADVLSLRVARYHAECRDFGVLGERAIGFLFCASLILGGNLVKDAEWRRTLIRKRFAEEARVARILHWPRKPWPGLAELWKKVLEEFPDRPAGHVVAPTKPLPGMEPEPPHEHDHDMPSVEEFLASAEPVEEDETTALEKAQALWRAGTPTPAMIDAAQVLPLEKMGFDLEDWRIFRETVAAMTSGGRYDVAGGADGQSDGKYLLGVEAKTAAAKALTGTAPDLSEEGRAAFRADAWRQEASFAAATAADFAWLMEHSEVFRFASDEVKLACLALAHGADAPRAADWLASGTLPQGGDTQVLALPEAVTEQFQARDEAEYAEHWGVTAPV